MNGKGIFAGAWVYELSALKQKATQVNDMGCYGPGPFLTVGYREGGRGTFLALSIKGDQRMQALL